MKAENLTLKELAKHPDPVVRQQARAILCIVLAKGEMEIPFKIVYDVPLPYSLEEYEPH